MIAGLSQYYDVYAPDVVFTIDEALSVSDEIKVRVDSNVECALEALQEADGVVNTRLISDPYANIKVSFKPSMLDKSIVNIILEKCNVTAEITESKLRQ